MTSRQGTLSTKIPSGFRRVFGTARPKPSNRSRATAFVRFHHSSWSICASMFAGGVRTGSGLLFATANGTQWDTDLLRKRKLYPSLQKLGIERCGFHAFRHGNETHACGKGTILVTNGAKFGL